MPRFKDENGLTLKQEKFCQYYVDGYAADDRGCATTAYERAFNCKNMKKSVIYNKAYEMMQKGAIRVRIQQLQDEMAKSHRVTREKIRSIRERIATLDILELFNVTPGGGLQMKKLNELPKDLREAISIKYDGGKWVLDFDKQKMLDALDKTLAEAELGDNATTDGLNITFNL